MTEENTGSAAAESTEAVNPFSSAEAFKAELEKAQNPPAAPVEEPKPEPAVEPVVAPTAGEDDEDDDFIDTDKGKMIPKGQFQKEKAKRRDLEVKMQQEHDARVKVERDLENLNAAIQQHLIGAPDKQENPDDLQLDPLDPETTNALTKQIKALQSKIEAMEGGYTADKANDSYIKSLEKQEAEYKATTPDWNDAYKHLCLALYNENIALGMDKATAESYAMDSLRQKAAIAYKGGKNVAEVAYSLAKNHGYIPKSAQQTQKTGPDLQKIAQNMDKSASISDIPASSTGSGGVAYTAELLQKIGGGKAFFPKEAFAKLLAQQQQR